MSEKFSPFFEDAVRTISFKTDEFDLTNAEYLRETEKFVLTKFENHSSAQDVKLNIFIDRTFNFSNIDVSDVLEETTTLNNKRNGTFGNFSTKCLNKCLIFGHHH